MTNLNQTISRNQPLPPLWKVERGLLAYLDENGFKREDYASKWTPAAILGIPILVPNTAKHRWAIMLHDLHHVATGYGTDTAGEGEIAAWEVRRGILSVGLYVGGIILSALLMGLIFAPRKTVAAWKSSNGKGSLFKTESHEYKELLEMSIGELRENLGLDRDGHYRDYRKLHSGAPGPDKKHVSVA